MKNLFKSILFIAIFILMVHCITYFLIPGKNVKEYGVLKAGNYEILSEEDNTIDTVFLGDSLVYSSISPMEIWNEYGYTTFNCSESAQITENAYKQLEIAFEKQKPKLVLMESNVLFRDPANQDIFDKIVYKIKRLLPIIEHHNNWKKYISSDVKNKWINYDKGYRYVKIVRPTKNRDYMSRKKLKTNIPEENLVAFEKIIKLCEKNNAKLVLMSSPTQKTWNYERHNTITKFAESKNIEFLDLNTVDIGINWEVDTRDKGSHVNSYGSKKVSKYIGSYLKSTNLVIDHREDLKYDTWNEAYKLYSNINN